MTAKRTTTLSPDVQAILARLRGQIRRYLFWEGVALVVALAGLLFWGSFFVDAAYFKLSRLELPRWLRAAFLIVSLAALVGGTVSLLAFRLLRVIRGRALALLLERRFPQLGDGLITAVEAAEGDWTPQGQLEDAMLARTVADASRVVQRLDIGSVFDPRPLRRAAIAATVLLVSVLGLAVVDSAAMERWLDGYWRLQPVYWPRSTELEVRVVTQPGDRLREFVEGRYRHPRGGDLQLEIATAPGKQAPDRVRLDYRLRGGNWKRTYLTTSADQPFRQSFPALLDDIEFWVTGGDFAASTPWRVDVVEPPRLDAIQLDLLYPEYTQLNSFSDAGVVERTPLTLQGAQLTLPLGTDVRFQATSNKPLALVRVEFDAGGERFQWSFESSATTDGARTILPPKLTVRARDELPERSASWNGDNGLPWLSADGRRFTFPFRLTGDGEQQLRQTITAADENGTWLPAVIPWPADATIRIHLEDVDSIASPEPARLTLNGLIDQPPIIEVELRGISSSITRQARIPVAGRIRDDYGIGGARFEFQVDNETDWRAQAFAASPVNVPREFELARSASQPFERFDVLPLDLSIKQRLILTVSATDNDSLTGPHVQRSQKFVFTIVPVEELLSLLYARELNLRQRFEQILTELKDLDQDLELHRKRAEALGGTAEEQAQTKTALTACGERSLHAIRKNASEMASIEQAFGEVRDELVNNAAETPQNMERLEGKILAPLTRATEEGFPAVDASLGLFALANDEGRNPVPAIRQSQEELRNLSAALERVLLEMRKLETFHEALELLKSIMSAHDELTEETKTQRKEKALRALE